MESPTATTATTDSTDSTAASYHSALDNDTFQIQNLNEEDPEEQFLRLQIEEINQSSACSKGKQPEGTANDYEVSLHTWKAEVDYLKTRLADQRMVKSMATALLEDDTMIATFTDQEVVAQNDRNIALALGGRQPEHRTEIPKTQEDPVNVSYEENLTRLAMKENYEIAIRYRSSDQSSPDHSVPHAESSTIPSKRKRTPLPITTQLPVRVKQQECTVCTDVFPIFDLANLPCGHDYCRGCVSRLFAESMVDETLYPPRCCRKSITFAHVRAFLDLNTADDFEERKEELSTTQRTYCRSPSCAKFIPKSSIRNDIGHCTACGVDTCYICKCVPHQGTDCPQDPALRAVVETAKAAGWQKCYACLRFVELVYGCNHITCRCGAQFCYECGEKWRTCDCEQWSEARLMGRAREIQERNPNQAPELREAQLNRIAADLRANHNCEHEEWDYITGEHECEECADVLPEYIFECQQCHLRACWRCRMNRL